MIKLTTFTSAKSGAGSLPASVALTTRSYRPASVSAARAGATRVTSPPTGSTPKTVASVFTEWSE